MELQIDLTYQQFLIAQQMHLLFVHFQQCRKCLFQILCIEREDSLTNEGEPNIICTDQTFSSETSKPWICHVSTVIMLKKQNVALSTSFRLDIKAILLSSNLKIMKAPITEGHNAKGVGNQPQQAGQETQIFPFRRELFCVQTSWVPPSSGGLQLESAVVCVSRSFC